MIKHEATRPLVFSPNYYQTRQNLLDIENLKVDDLDIHAYRYVINRRYLFVAIVRKRQLH
ncbi:O-antigen chain length determinant Wzz [Escherichia coli]|uniref:O-antigen chain length determinant Wzz n=1 Tax=Escherichia coli TaxID=562 RepID=A0A376U7G6_ECOLX|nr:O-antigen chain length determinant Wzz [Escherichia coli]